MNSFRDCGDCHACCDGHLIGEVYGHSFGHGKKCFYFIQEKCTIYEQRPEMCRKYQCAWTQNLLPEWMKPNKTGLLVSVEDEPSGKQYLKAVEMWPNIEYHIYNEIESFCKTHNTYYVKVPYESGHTQL